jgi:ABC-2 type transport system ATP-binding protein
VGLTKRYGRRTAVDGLDLQVPAGSISGFVGPNGAGKTTTIRMLLGLAKPTAGSARVLGVPLEQPKEYLSSVGALIDGPTFYPTLSGRENLAVLAKLSGIPRRRIDETLERVGLENRSKDPFRTYSLGMKQRLGIAAALLPDPALMILDEPTNGLDPHGIAEIRSLLKSFAAEGRTVFVSSHLLSEIQQICQHLIVIEHGRLVFQGDVEVLLASLSPVLLVRTEHPGDSEALLSLVAKHGRKARIIGSKGARGIQTIEIEAESNWAAELNRAAMKAGITLSYIAQRDTTLEEAFFLITGKHRDGVVPPLATNASLIQVDP